MPTGNSTTHRLINSHKLAAIYADENGGVTRVLNNKFTEVVQNDVDNNGDGQWRISDREGKQFSTDE